MPEKLHAILSIAAADPMGGAGIQTDIRCGNLLGVHVLTAITGVTVQNSKGFYDSGVVNPSLLKHQLEVIFEESVPQAIKIGMIGNIENFKVIENFLNTLPYSIPIVIDPVIKATADNNIEINSEFEDFYLNYLFPIAFAVTPNLIEFEKLSGVRFQDIKEYNDIPKLLNTNNVIIKGGHAGKNIIEDFLISEEKIIIKTHPRLECLNLHGTGCAFSSFMASFLALGKNIQDSFSLTSDLMHAIISKSCDYRLGTSSNGPLNIDNYLF